MLASHRKETIPAPIVNNTNLFSIFRFFVKVGREDVVYALLPRENSAVNENPNLRAEVQQLLTELSDLMPKDLPPGLLPMKNT